MSFVLTYTTLVENVIPDYLERTDPQTLANIPIWVSNAQNLISRDLGSLGFTAYLTGTLNPDQAVYQKPNGWSNTLNINIGSGVDFNTMNNLQLRTYTFLTEYWPDRTQTALPKYYTDYGYSNWLISPTPDQAYPFEASFLGLGIAIDATHSTNWLTEFAPDLLIKATLREGMIYLKNDQRLELLNQEYAKILESLKSQSQNRITDSAAMSTKGYSS